MSYTVLQFRVTTTGHYQFRVQAPSHARSTYTLLYENAFDPEAPLGNVLTGNDCSKVGSTFHFVLTAGKRYFFVITGDGADEAVSVEPCSYTIRGPGQVVHLGAGVGMASENFALMAVGLATMLAISRRKSAAQSLGRPAGLLTHVAKLAPKTTASIINMQPPESAGLPFEAVDKALPPLETVSQPMQGVASSGASSGYLPLQFFLRKANG